MLDTVRIASPSLSEDTIAAIERSLERLTAVDLATGEMLYEFTRGDLEGSFDHRVAVQVRRYRWHVPPRTLREITEDVVGGTKKTRSQAIKVDSPPYIVLEGSVHKAMLGHNVHGGAVEWYLPVCWFVSEMARRLGVVLPSAEDWTVQRVDVAEAFELGSVEAVQEYIEGLNMAAYPRRRVLRYGIESIMSPGRTTSIKCYDKGAEFDKHDYKRLRDFLTESELAALRGRAQGILRVETSIKSRKLSEMFGQEPTVVQVAMSKLEAVHDREIARLLREGAIAMQTVRTRREVSRRLHDTHSGELANVLLGTWFQLATLGERETRKNIPRPTFYRHRKMLTDAGCSWLSSDIVEVGRTAIPAGFSPVRSDVRRLVEESPEVRRILSSYDRPAQPSLFGGELVRIPA